MGAATDGVPFPVIFFNGEQETEIGNVFIDASLSFKTFQLILSNRIGISHHQISIYLVDRKRSRLCPRKIPITRKVDFAAFLHEKDSVFYAVLKRSRRERRRIDKRDSAGYGFGFDRTPPAKVMLLRRNEGVGGDRPISVLLPLAQYESRGRRLKMEMEMERERFSLEMGLSDLRLDREDATKRRVPVGNGGGLVVCEECLRAENTGIDPGFHWCVYDTVTVGFRSPAGPIARPGEESG